MRKKQPCQIILDRNMERFTDLGEKGLIKLVYKPMLELLDSLLRKR